MPKHIANETKVVSLDGEPFQIPDPKQKLKAGEELRMVDAAVTDLFKLVVFNAVPRDKMTHEDTVHGAALYSQVTAIRDDVPAGTLVVNNDEWEWFEKTWKTYAPRIFAMNTDHLFKTYFKFLP